MAGTANLIAVEQIRGAFIGADIGRVAKQVIKSARAKTGLLHTTRIERISAIDMKLCSVLAYLPVLIKQKWQALYKQVDRRQVTGKGIEVETYDGAGQDIQCLLLFDLASSKKVLQYGSLTRRCCHEKRSTSARKISEGFIEKLPAFRIAIILYIVSAMESRDIECIKHIVYDVRWGVELPFFAAIMLFDEALVIDLAWYIIMPRCEVVLFDKLIKLERSVLAGREPIEATSDACRCAIIEIVQDM